MDLLTLGAANKINDSRRIEITKTSAAAIGGIKITHAGGTDDYEKTGIYVLNKGYGLAIMNQAHATGNAAIMLVNPAAATAAQYLIYASDNATSAPPMICINHKSSQAQAYGMNFINNPGAQPCLVAHQYSSVDSAMIIDNVGTGNFIRLRNARNQSIVPDVLGTGDYIRFQRYDSGLEELGHIDDECDFYFTKTGGVNGVCLLDRTLGTYYRILVNNGTLGVEAVS